MSCYGFSYSPKPDDARPPTVPRADPLISNIAPLATILVDLTGSSQSFSVSKDKGEVSLFEHVILTLTADLFKATDSQLATRGLRRNADGDPVADDPADFPSLYVADKQYILDAGLHKDTLSAGDRLVNIVGVPYEPDKFHYRNIWRTPAYMIRRAQSKMVEIIWQYVNAGSFTDVVDLFPGSHLLQD